MVDQSSQAFTDDKFWADHWDRYQHRQIIPASIERGLRKAASRHYRRLFRRMVSLAECRTGSILEIGCAPGSVLEKIHWACPQLKLHGIDYSESGVAMTKERLRANRIDATLYHGDAFDVAVSERFDIVLSVGVIEHFDDPLPMVKAHLRLCKTGGHILICVPYFAPIPRFFFQRFDPGFLATHNLSTLQLTRLRKIMEMAHLQDIQVGKFGPPLLWATHDESKRFGKLYSACASVWNVSVSILPFPPLWRTSLWAIGRVPIETA